jgi:hypothetical protein
MTQNRRVYSYRKASRPGPYYIYDRQCVAYGDAFLHHLSADGKLADAWERLPHGRHRVSTFDAASERVVSEFVEAGTHTRHRQTTLNGGEDTREYANRKLVRQTIRDAEGNIVRDVLHPT